MISVFVLTGPNKDQSFEFEKDSIRIGRSKENDIHLIDRNVSRNHVEIFKENEYYSLIDLGSKNGTYIDGKKLDEDSKIIINKAIPILIGTSVLCLGRGCEEHVRNYFNIIDIPESDEEVLRHSVMNYQQNIDLMNELSGILSEALAFSNMMQKVLEIIFQVFAKINRAAIILVNPETGDIVESESKASTTMDDTSFTYDLDVVNQVLKTNKPFQFLDAFDEYEDGISETLKISKIRSVICLPLPFESKIVGVMYIDSIEKPKSFLKEDVYLMKLLSNQIGPRLAGFVF